MDVVSRGRKTRGVYLARETALTFEKNGRKIDGLLYLVM